VTHARKLIAQPPPHAVSGRLQPVNQILFDSWRGSIRKRKFTLPGNKDVPLGIMHLADGKSFDRLLVPINVTVVSELSETYVWVREYSTQRTNPRAGQANVKGIATGG